MKIWKFLTPFLGLSIFFLIGHFFLGGKEGGYNLYEALSGSFIVAVILYVGDL